MTPEQAEIMIDLLKSILAELAEIHIKIDTAVRLRVE
jgi:hypothetical protein